MFEHLLWKKYAKQKQYSWTGCAEGFRQKKERKLFREKKIIFSQFFTKFCVVFASFKFMFANKCKILRKSLWNTKEHFSKNFQFFAKVFLCWKHHAHQNKMNSENAKWQIFTVTYKKINNSKLQKLLLLTTIKCDKI